jgi:ribosomal protein S18 acetylase RimI-like enzyme
VRRALPADSRAVARLHREVISWALLSRLGEDVTTAFYHAVSRSDVAFCFVVEQEGQIAGFAAGVADWRRLYRQMIQYMWWPLIKSAPRMLAAARWRRLLETGRYAQSGHEGVAAEFLSFGVREDARGRLWVGSALARAIVGEFRRRGIPRIRGVVWERNERAVKFFEAMGFRFVSDVDIHPGERSRTFVVDISPDAAGPTA